MQRPYCNCYNACVHDEDSYANIKQWSEWMLNKTLSSSLKVSHTSLQTLLGPLSLFQLKCNHFFSQIYYWALRLFFLFLLLLLTLSFFIFYSQRQHEHPGFYLKGTFDLYILAFSIIYMLLKKEKTCSFVMGGGGRGGAYLTDVGREANSKWQEKNGHDIQHVSVQLELAARCKQRIKNEDLQTESPNYMKFKAKSGRFARCTRFSMNTSQQKSSKWSVISSKDLKGQCSK